MVNLSDTGRRLKELRKERGFSRDYIGAQLNVTPEEYSLMESSGKGITSEHVIALSRLHKVTSDFLLTGNRKLIDKSREKRFMPFIPVKAHAGFLKNLQEEDLFDSFEHYRIPGYNPTQDSLLVEVEGNSMEPTITSGEIVICQTQPKPDRVPDGSAVVLLTRDQIIISRLYQHSEPEFFWIESDNPEHSGRKKISRSDIRQLLMVRGKVSHLPIPPLKTASQGKLKSLEDSLDSLKKEVYQVRKTVEELKKE